MGPDPKSVAMLLIAKKKKAAEADQGSDDAMGDQPSEGEKSAMDDFKAALDSGDTAGMAMAMKNFYQICESGEDEGSDDESQAGEEDSES